MMKCWTQTVVRVQERGTAVMLVWAALEIWSKLLELKKVPSDWQQLLQWSQTHCQCSKSIIKPKHTVENHQLWTGLPRAQNSTLLRKCGIILTENREKGRNVQRRAFNVLQKVWETVLEHKKWQSCLRVHVLKSKGAHTKYSLTFTEILQCVCNSLSLS